MCIDSAKNKMAIKMKKAANKNRMNHLLPAFSKISCFLLTKGWNASPPITGPSYFLPTSEFS